MSIETLIKEKLQGIQGCYIAPEIPEKKLNNAIKSIAPGIDPDYVVAICDTTLLGSAKDGCVFLGDSIYCKESFEKPVVIKYEDIEEVKYEESPNTKENGKQEVVQNAYVKLHSEKIINIIEALPSKEASLLVELLNEIVSNGKEGAEFNTTNQCLPLQAMNTEIKLAYIKLVCNFAFSNDGKIDAKEYAEIMSLLVRVQIREPETRLLLREYMNSEETIEDSRLLLNMLKKQIPSGSWDIVQKSLMKDILYIYKLENSIQNWKSSNTILELQEKLEISDEQVDVLAQSIQSDEDILNQRKSDTEIQKSIKELAAGATAVGVPMAAIYFSGSVVGMSAVGMTSGLAALGMGGVLGLSSMATGLGIVALLGVASYKGVKKATGLSEIDNNRQRELMLQEVIKNSQKTQNYLIEDVNVISHNLMQALSEKSENKEKIKKMAGLITKLSKGLKQMEAKLKDAEKESIITKIPGTLHVARFNEMTDSATRRKYREFVMGCYKNETIKTEDGEEKIVYRLDYNKLNIDDTEKLYEILDTIGYLNLKDTSVASMKGFAKKAAKGILDK